MDNEKKQANIKVYGTKEEYDRIFAEIKSLPKDMEPEAITKFIQNKLTLSIFFGLPVEGEPLKRMPIYRARVAGKPIDESKVSEFGYPPPEFCCAGRANREGEQVFYSAGDMHTAIFEKAHEINIGESEVYVSSWEVTNNPGQVHMRNLFYGVERHEYSDEDYAAVMIDGLKEFFDQIVAKLPDRAKENYCYGQKLYNDLFSWDSKEHYHLSSAIAHDTFVQAFKQGVDLPILAYPSVAKKRKAINFAFRKDFADRHLRLKEVFKIVVTKIEDEKVSFNPIRRGVSIDGENIVWSDLELRLKKFEDSLLISFEEQPINLKRVAPDEILTCCPKHFFTAKEFVETLDQFKESVLFDAIKEQGHHLDLMNLPLQNESLVLVPLDHKIFFKDRKKSEQRIRFIGMPIAFAADFSPIKMPEVPFKDAS
jgi:hypothetical protein